jgi:hypothetical protein
MKAPDKFDGEHSSKLRGFLQSCKILFSNDPATFSLDRQKVLYASSYLSGRASQWFEPYLELLSSTNPDCILNNWGKFEQQLFTLFGDPNEVRNAEFEINSLLMKENGKASTYIAQFRVLQSHIDWNDAALLFHFRKGLPSRITDQLAVSGHRLSPLQHLIDRTIELDNCYHDRSRTKKTDSTPSTQDQASKQSSKSNSKKTQLATSKPSTSTPQQPRTKIPQEISKVLNTEGGLKADEKARREKEGLCMYCGGKHQLDACAKRAAREAAKLSKN